MASFKLPDPAGRAGGALTAALLNVTYADHHDTGKDLTFKETLHAVRASLQSKGFEQIPQLSSSRPTDMDEHFAILPRDFAGKRHAVMIGINYVGVSLHHHHHHHYSFMRVFDHDSIAADPFGASLTDGESLVLPYIFRISMLFILSLSLSHSLSTFI